MGLTPAERVRLNAAIVRSTQTGQPLSPELQAMYKSAAQDTAAKKQNQYPTEEEFRQAREEFASKGGENPTEVTAPQSRVFGENTSPLQSTATVKEFRDQFLNKYFPGESGEVINPATGNPYGKELYIHDAAHQFANISPSLRGENQQTIIDKFGTVRFQPLGATGFTQQPFAPTGANLALEEERVLSDLFKTARTTTKTQNRQGTGTSLFRDRNQVSSFLSPKFSETEINELTKRSREFYDQIHAGLGKDLNELQRLDKEIEGMKQYQKSNPEFMSKSDLREMVEPLAMRRFDIKTKLFDKAANIPIKGGYSTPNALPYGPVEQFMNAPLVPTVDAALYNKFLDKSIDRQAFNDINDLALENIKWKKGVPLLDVDTEFDESGRERFVKPLPDKPVSQRLKGSVWSESTIGNQGEWGYADPRELIMDRETGKDLLKQSYREGIESVQDTKRQWNSGAKSGVPWGSSPGENVYLNPPNLGSNIKEARTRIDRRTGKPITHFSGAPFDFIEDALITAPVEARNYPRLVNAIKTGFDVTNDIAGSVPLFDPSFRQAVEKGDVGKAARQVATDYAVGAAAAPVVGAGMGVLNQVAPGAARIATGALGAARVANPVAVTSQLGGSSIINRKADEAAIRSQVQRAEAARRRGGRWKFPTPFGSITVPELGISEAGGLFFR